MKKIPVRVVTRRPDGSAESVEMYDLTPAQLDELERAGARFSDDLKAEVAKGKPS